MALFPLKIKSLISGEEFIITVDPKHTIRSIKETLADNVDILADNQILIHRGEFLDDKRILRNFRNLVELNVMGYIILVEKGLFLAINDDNCREVYNILKSEKLLLKDCKNLSNPRDESNSFPGSLRTIDFFTSSSVAGYIGLLSMLLRMKLITDVNQLDNNGNNAGHYAASIGSIKILKLLFDNGLDKGMKNKKNESMIEIACKFYYRSEVTIPNHSRSTRLSSLTTTLAMNSNIIRYLIQEKGFSKDTMNSNGSTLISYATSHCNITVCEELISLRCSLEIKNSTGDTPFLIACRNGFLEIARLLLNAGCNHRIKGRDGSFPLMICCKYRHVDICKELLARRFDTEEKNNDGDTTLLVVCEKNDIVFCKLLLESGCNPNATNNFGTNALMNGGKYGYLDICKVLLSAGCDKDVQDNEGDNLFIHVCRNGHLDVCKYLIDVVGFDKEVKNNKGENAFLLSTQYGRLDICKYLFDSGVDTSVSDNSGYTALHLASKGNKFDMVKFLVNDVRVDLISIDSNGKTAQDLIPRWSTFRGEMNDFFKTEIDKRYNHGFKREMLAEVEGEEDNDGGGDFDGDDDKEQEIVVCNEGNDRNVQNLSKKARFE